LPIKEGFEDNPGIVVDGRVYALQNGEYERGGSGQEEEEDGDEDDKNFVCFDGHKWEQIKLEW
jgi:hypothetical protein